MGDGGDDGGLTFPAWRAWMASVAWLEVSVAMITAWIVGSSKTSWN